MALPISSGTRTTTSKPRTFAPPFCFPAGGAGAQTRCDQLPEYGYPSRGRPAAVTRPAAHAASLPSAGGRRATKPRGSAEVPFTASSRVSSRLTRGNRRSGRHQARPCDHPEGDRRINMHGPGMCCRCRQVLNGATFPNGWPASATASSPAQALGHQGLANHDVGPGDQLGDTGAAAACASLALWAAKAASSALVASPRSRGCCTAPECCLVPTSGAAMFRLGRQCGQRAHRASGLGRRGGVLLLRRRRGARLWPTACTGWRRSRRWRRWTAAGSRGPG